MTDNQITNDPVIQEFLDQLTQLANKNNKTHILLVKGYDPDKSSDYNTSYRHGLRIFLTNLAAQLHQKGYEVSRVIFGQLIKAVDGVYHDPEYRKAGTQLNIRFVWEDISNYPVTVDSITRKKIRNSLTVRLAYFHTGNHVYDLNGNFAVSRVS